VKNDGFGKLDFFQPHLGAKFSMGPEPVSCKVNYLGKQFSGSTLGIIGMGRIGICLAKKALGFGCRILYHNRSKRCDDDEYNGKNVQKNIKNK